MSKKNLSMNTTTSKLSSVEADQPADKERTARLAALPAPKKKSPLPKVTSTTRSHPIDVVEMKEPIQERLSTPPQKSLLSPEKQTMHSRPSIVYMNAPITETSSAPSLTSPLWKKKQTTFPDLSVATEMKNPATFEERCRKLALALFLDRDTNVQSLGITSAIAGEGKSFIATTFAQYLAKSIKNPVTLLECNWEHPCIHEYFSLPAEPGLAEWLRGECEESAVCHQIRPNLTVIPAGKGRDDAVKLLQLLQEKQIADSFLQDGGFLLADLPPVINVAYGVLAASIVEDLLLVVHTGATTNLMVTEMLYQLKDLHIQGVILNQMKSRIPRWIRWLF
jgi:Mrp family chromosome partitioning ATPase